MFKALQVLRSDEWDESLGWTERQKDGSIDARALTTTQANGKKEGKAG